VLRSVAGLQPDPKAEAPSCPRPHATLVGSTVARPEGRNTLSPSTASHDPKIDYDPARGPKRSLTCDHLPRSKDRSQPDPKAERSLTLNCRLRSKDRSRPDPKVEHSLTLDRQLRSKDRSRPNPKAETLSHPRPPATFESSITPRPEGRIALSLSTALGNLQIDCEPTQRLKRPLTFDRPKQPGG
jgi:hypothetical protein